MPVGVDDAGAAAVRWLTASSLGPDAWFVDASSFVAGTMFEELHIDDES